MTNRFVQLLANQLRGLDYVGITVPNLGPTDDRRLGEGIQEDLAIQPLGERAIRPQLLHFIRCYSEHASQLNTYTLSSPIQAQVEIRKSRFIGLVIPVENRDSAMLELKALRVQHSGAAHICWALLAGGQSGMSDDGEPSGTAGRPILEVLRHHELDGVLGAVVRYYGGIKLGAGGLVRAYTDAIAIALKDAERIERVARTDLAVEVDYADEARVRRWIEQRHYTLDHSAHGTVVTLVIRLPSTELSAAREGLQQLTQGRSRFRGLSGQAS